MLQRPTAFYATYAMDAPWRGAAHKLAYTLHCFYATIAMDAILERGLTMCRLIRFYGLVLALHPCVTYKEYHN
jgi:hypothetical protein